MKTLVCSANRFTVLPYLVILDVISLAANEVEFSHNQRFRIEK